MVRIEQKLLQVLKNCGNFEALKQTHLQILIHGLQDDMFLLPKLVDRSSTLHSLEYALRLVTTAESPGVVAYNTYIKACNQNCRRSDAVLVFNRMKESAVAPNNFTFTFLLKSCDLREDFNRGAQIHAQIVKSGYGCHLFVQNTLLDFYSKCSMDMGLVNQLFDEMSELDVVSWNTMIKACIAHGEMELALKLFELMPERNIVSWNSVLSGLCKFGDMETAKSIFECMPERNTASSNAMITGYIKNGDMGSAQKVFDPMPDKDVVSWTAMVAGYAKTGDLGSAIRLFDEMPFKNGVSWSAMIAGYAQNRFFDKALSMFHQMLMVGGLRPDETTLLSVLSACAHLGTLEQGRWIDSYIKMHKYELTIALGNALIDMYAKCGNFQQAKQVFKQMEKRCIITWTTMISALALNGECHEALSLFDAMCQERMEPDDVVFIVTMTACSHGGLVEEGKRVFDKMVTEYRIEPRLEHYGCMVDLLSRAGRFEEAIVFIQSMPMEPSAVIWASLLGSCKFHENEELARLFSKKVLDLEPSNSGYQVLVSNLNAASSQWDSVLNMRAKMKEDGVDKVAGCSSIQIGMGVHEFLAEDVKHPQRREIYEILDGLTFQLKAIGYVPGKFCYGAVSAS